MGKRHRIPNGVEKEDRLSSLPDDIVIGILSRLPLDLAILSGLLSRRWRDLWTNINSIYLTTQKFNNYSEFVIDYIMMQIISPVIHTFTLEFYFKQGCSTLRQSSIYYWRCKIRDKSVRELKVSNTFYGHFRIPSFVFRSQSLVSVELDSVLCNPLDSIDLPKLKRLFVTSVPLWKWTSFDKLMKGCPLLEELSLKWLNTDLIREDYIRLSHGNLKQFSMYDNRTCKCINIVTSSPKLEYMDIQGLHSITVSFDEEPISLQEIKSVMSSDVHSVVFRKGNKLTSEFHTIRRLTFVVLLLSNIENMLTLVGLCPALEILNIQFEDYGWEESNIAKLSYASVLQRVKKIVIATCYRTYINFRKSFRKLVKALLCKLTCLEEFHFQMNNEYSKVVDVKEELILCKLLYSYPMISTSSDVHFSGQIFEMSRKLGRKAWKANGEVYYF